MSAHSHRSSSGSDPATTFDHWLDDVVTGTPGASASRSEQSSGQLARAQAGARQLHGLAAHAVAVPALKPARQRVKEHVMHTGAIATTNGGNTWNPRQRPERHVPWWSLNSPFVAAALMIALIASLLGGAFWNQRLILAPEPSSSSGFAVSSPEDGALSCGAPGYRPVVEGEADADALASIGETQKPITVNDDGVTVPGPDGRLVELPPSSWPSRTEPGVYITAMENGDRRVTNTSIDEVWDFPALDVDGLGETLAPGVFTFAQTGPFVIAPADSQGFDWTILDVRNGDSVTTSELLGGTFPWLVLPIGTSAIEHDTDYTAVQFIRATQSFPSITNERVADDEGAVTDRLITNTHAVLLPGSVEQAAIVDLGGLTRSFNALGFSSVTFSRDASQVAWLGWDDNGEEAGYFAIFVAASDDIEGGKLIRKISAPLGYRPLMFSPDNSNIYVLADNSIEVASVAGGGVKQVAVIGQQSLNVFSRNDFSGTILFFRNHIVLWEWNERPGNMAP